LDQERVSGMRSRPGHQAPDPGAFLGELVGDSRRAAGLTQRELAALAGVGLGTVRDVEQGRRSRPRSLTRLAAALGLDVARARERAAERMPAPRWPVEGAAVPRGRGRSADASIGRPRLRILGPLDA
jgi:transcriptional regulator with XRE-family HTH domain